MTALAYTKMSGAGNTFIVVDDKALPRNMDPAALAPNICAETLEHEGADGFIAVCPWSDGDFEMRYYNRDGSTGMMCGNGARCAVRFAVDHGYVKDTERITFRNAGIVYTAALTDMGVRVNFPDPKFFKLRFAIEFLGEMRPCHYADVGTPHAIVLIDEVGDPNLHHLEQIDLNIWGPALRRHPDFAPEGANANFVEVIEGESTIRLRTFERGVEAETGACGTGAIATAIVASTLRKLPPPITVIPTSGSPLRVDFRVEKGYVVDVGLEGGADVVREGTLNLDDLSVSGNAG